MFKKLYKWLKLFLLVVWLLAMLVVGMWIFVENSQKVTVNYFGYQAGDQALGFVICQMLFMGAVLGYITCLVSFKSRAIWYKRRYQQAQKKLEKLKNPESAKQSEVLKLAETGGQSTHSV